MRDHYPLTTPQYNIWIQEQSSGRPEINTIDEQIRFETVLDSRMLELAINRVVEHGDALRLRLAQKDGEVSQWVEPHVPFSVRKQKVKDEAELEQRRLHRAVQPFSLYGERLCDFEIIQVADRFTCVDMRVHHIVADGFGAALTCRQIVKAYAALSRGEEPVWAQHSYLDAVKKDAAYLEEGLEADRAYWRQTLSGYDSFRRLGGKEPGNRYQIAHHRDVVSAELSGRIRAFCRERNTTPYHVFFSAFSLFLSRLCGSEDIAVATARLNRDTPEERETLGDFTVSVPVRVKLERAASFGELLAQSYAANREAAAHKRLGLSRIVDDWKRQGGAGALTDYTLSFQNVSARVEELPCQIVQSPAGAAAVSLALHISDWSGSGQYQLIADYREEDYRPGEMERMCRHLLTLLENALAMPDAPLGELQVTTGPERIALLESQRVTVSHDTSQTILSMFSQVAKRHPARIILTAVDGALSFRQLDALSDKYCNALIEQGAKRGDIIPFLLPRTLDLIPVMLGILKAGCAYLPLDYSFPAERVRYILEDCGARLMITKEGNPMEGLPCPVVALRALKECDAPFAQRPQVTPDDLCYVIYTSGTTGRPKGVMIEHKGIVNIAQPHNNPFNTDVVENGRGIVVVGSICFDISMFEIFVTMLNGVPMVLADAQQMSNPVELARLIAENATNILHCTPSRLVSYMEEPAFAKVMGRVDMILSAGETLTKPFFNLLRTATQARVYNGYGPTEVTIGATVGLADETLGIGRPVAGARVYILDEYNHPLPPGAVGEIVVGGMGLSRGYVGNGEMDREKFIWFEGERVYRTGDLGYLNDDGTLGYIGRIDQQVKIRGLRIELGEIEKCLGAHDALEQVVVLVRELGGREHLCCFYTASRPVESEELKKLAAAYLPAYMVPELFVPLEAMPATVNGKVDKKALANLEVSIERTYVPPETELEALLCDVFAEVLELESVGATDNFFELGGTSLLAARILMGARKRGVSIPFEMLFKHSTPRELGKNLGSVTVSTDREITDYDYTAIHDLLAANRNFEMGPGDPMECVLLTGSTGYLGIHLLVELLTKYRCKVCCLVRSQPDFPAETRLQGALFYYFENSFSELFRQRLFVLEGDITSPELFKEGQEIPRFDTVINCAANVAHFSHDGSIEAVNTRGVKHLIRYCLRNDARLIQISTMSVGGFITQAALRTGVRLTEHNLYLNQNLDNAYLRSKFLAERELLAAAAEQGLKVKIMRVGNLQGRMSDGEFQMNMKTNNFTRLLQSFVLTEKCSQSMTGATLDFSPVDYVSTAIAHMCQTASKYTVFHVFGSSTTIGDLLDALREIGHPVDILPDEEFADFLDQLSGSKEGQKLAEGFVARISTGSGLMETPCDITFTKEALMDRGFLWPKITRDYLQSNLMALDTLGFFEADLQ